MSDGPNSGSTTAGWFYASAEGRAGPKTIAEMRRLLEVGEITVDTLVWCQAFGQNWKPFSDAGIAQAEMLPPPLPSPGGSSTLATDGSIGPPLELHSPSSHGSDRNDESEERVTAKVESDVRELGGGMMVNKHGVKVSKQRLTTEINIAKLKAFGSIVVLLAMILAVSTSGMTDGGDAKYARYAIILVISVAAAWGLEALGFVKWVAMEMVVDTARQTTCPNCKEAFVFRHSHQEVLGIQQKYERDSQGLHLVNVTAYRDVRVCSKCGHSAMGSLQHKSKRV